ncbi:MAG: hypothetical protein KatS3mg119_1740 [Rhodothalassiaceae bacterium]|nr:MAG: hypothetical protein KatS3mg119_1740 [Rhodothalassiaceae bacterium]
MQQKRRHIGVAGMSGVVAALLLAAAFRPAHAEAAGEAADPLPAALAPVWERLAPAVPRDLLGGRLRFVVHDAPLPEMLCAEEEVALQPGEATEGAEVDPPERLVCSLSPTLLAARGPAGDGAAAGRREDMLLAALAHAAVHAIDAVESRMELAARKAKGRRRLVGLFSWAALILGGGPGDVHLGPGTAPWLRFYGTSPDERPPPDHPAGAPAANLHRYGVEPDPWLAHRMSRARMPVERLLAIERIVDAKAAVLLLRIRAPADAQLLLHDFLARYRLTNLHRWPGFDAVSPHALREAAALRAQEATPAPLPDPDARTP